MALSMDEQRMLAEIERRLAAEDPGLAVRLSSFRRPGPGAKLRSPRGRIIGSLFTVALVAVISMMVYAMVPFRVHNPKSITPQSSGRPAVSAPARIGSPASSAASAPKISTPARAAITSEATTPKTAGPRAGSHPSTSARAAGTSVTSKASGTQTPSAKTGLTAK